MKVFVVIWQRHDYSRVVGVGDSIDAANLLIARDIENTENDRWDYDVYEHNLKAVQNQPSLVDFTL